MIAPLRRRHRLLVAWVGAIALAAFVAALAARPPRPLNPGPARTDTSSWAAFGPDGGIRAIRERESGREWVRVARGPRLVSPDLLVYWAPAGGAGAELPVGAVLLGPLGDPGVRHYELPASDTPGVILIFSLGHDRLVATQPLGSVGLIDRNS